MPKNKPTLADRLEKLDRVFARATERDERLNRSGARILEHRLPFQVRSGGRAYKAGV